MAQCPQQCTAVLSCYFLNNYNRLKGISTLILKYNLKINRVFQILIDFNGLNKYRQDQTDTVQLDSSTWQPCSFNGPLFLAGA